MAIHLAPFIFSFFFLCIIISFAVGEGNTSTTPQRYIIRVHLPPGLTAFSSSEDRLKWYMSFLPSGTSEPRLFHSYEKIFDGFAARLTDQELLLVKNKTGFLHARPDRILPLKTTHSPSFLGLQRDVAGFWNESNYGKGVIIGVLDTGISPDHPSFNDAGIPPPPAKWQGVCEFNASQCNNKLIGARDLTAVGSVLQGPYDYEGHGTHTASTAAGNFVDDASINGLANGTASGIAPYAHLAIYKVCTPDGCAMSDILKGMDTAIGDGVDVMSLSIGGGSLPFYLDDMAIGAWAAVNTGIFVSFAAGNEGPSLQTLSNEAPWVLTVGASTIDRLIQTEVTLGTNIQYFGQSAYQPSDYSPTLLPLVYPGASSDLSVQLCSNGSLDAFNVQGAIVVCLVGNISNVDKGEIVKQAGGAGIIIPNGDVEGSTTSVDPYEIPASQVGYIEGTNIISYVTTDTNPMASISFQGTLLGTSPAPAIAYFSSRGPSMADPNILKPDIIGPGMNILAAWPFPVGYVGTMFNMISGTSMATPHLSGVAALLKSTHPDWSPAAIKSAIMTTANIIANDGNIITDQAGNPASFFSIGAGQVVPASANNPGLIYDIKPEDYLQHLCGLGYTDQEVSLVAASTVACADIGMILPQNLNYPSFTVFLTSGNNYVTEVTRTVTNVGAPSSTYTLQALPSFEGLSIDVVPQQLPFSSVNQDIQYSVTFNSSSLHSGYAYEGFLAWVSSDGTITVQSPTVIVVN